MFRSFNDCTFILVNWLFQKLFSLLIEINEVRVLTSIRTGLDCDDYNEVQLAALLENAKATLPEQLLPILNTIPESQRLTAVIAILGIRLVVINCKSNLLIYLKCESCQTSQNKKEQ